MGGGGQAGQQWVKHAKGAWRFCLAASSATPVDSVEGLRSLFQPIENAVESHFTDLVPVKVKGQI